MVRKATCHGPEQQDCKQTQNISKLWPSTHQLGGDSRCSRTCLKVGIRSETGHVIFCCTTAHAQALVRCTCHCTVVYFDLARPAWSLLDYQNCRTTITNTFAFRTNAVGRQSRLIGLKKVTWLFGGAQLSFVSTSSNALETHSTCAAPTEMRTATSPRP